MSSSDSSVVVVKLVTHRYGKVIALDAISLTTPAGSMMGVIGPDGVGKSTLLSLVAGARAIQTGTVTVLGGDMSQRHHRDLICPRIAYMPQGLGKNLYPTLSVEENLQFFGRLFGHDARGRRQRIDQLTKDTELFSFLGRQAGNLSGGMKQKLGLCCALIHDPDLLILDEPTTGVDPLARAQFWTMIARIRSGRPKMSVIVATAYMDEAQNFDTLIAMDAGKILATGSPEELLARTNASDLEKAFIGLLPERKKRGYEPVVIAPLQTGDPTEIAIEAKKLTMRFGDFVAVDHVDFEIRRGEIFGFLGSNGCGKSTTMKMLTGLLPASEGRAWLFGKPVDASEIETRRRVGYMSQSFSLYSELTVRQNLTLHAKLFHVAKNDIAPRVREMAERFGLGGVMESLPESLPLGMRQRLSLAVAMVHKPELLILDEPTSGVDPVARDEFWRHLVALSREDHVTLFISTHFMNEAERCDRISLMHAGKVLVSDSPANIVSGCGTSTLDAAFIAYLTAAGCGTLSTERCDEYKAALHGAYGSHEKRRSFSFDRMYSYLWRESLELRRDPVRLLLALLGSAILMLVMGYGISMDVEDLTYAVLDRDQTTLSQNYSLNIAGSRFFLEQPPLIDYQDMETRLRSGKLALAVEIPPGFARDLARGKPVQIGIWVDGAMPMRAETVVGYVQGMHQVWLAQQASHRTGAQDTQAVSIETRFRYNPDVKSLPAMVPGVIPLLLMMLPAMLAALSVVREKELGSILNLYVTPVTRMEFLLGKQIPYVALGMLNFFLMSILAVTLFRVPIKGDFITLAVAAIIFNFISTGVGLFASTFTRSQIAALFLTIIGTMIPTIQFAGLLTPVSSMEGSARLIGEIYPATHMLIITRGVFNKALGFAELYESYWPLLLAVPPILGLTALLLAKQAR